MYMIGVTFTLNDRKTHSIKYGRMQMALEAKDEMEAYHVAREKIIDLTRKEELLGGLNQAWLDSLMKIKHPPPEPIVLHVRYLTRPPDPDLCYDLPGVDAKIAVSWSTSDPDATKSEQSENPVMVDMAEEKKE